MLVLLPIFVHVHTVSPERDPCRLPLGFTLLVGIESERTDKYSFNYFCNSLWRTTQQPQQSPASSHEPFSQEGIAAVLGKPSRVIQPRGDCLGFGTKLRNFKMTTPPPRFLQHKTICRRGRTIRERWECPARPLTLSSNSFLKVSAAPAFEARNELVGTVPVEQLVARTWCLGRLKALPGDSSQSKSTAVAKAWAMELYWRWIAPFSFPKVA